MTPQEYFDALDSRLERLYRVERDLVRSLTIYKSPCDRFFTRGYFYVIIPDETWLQVDDNALGIMVDAMIDALSAWEPHA